MPRREADIRLPIDDAGDPDDFARIRDLFGADDAQVQRDHAISQILAVLSRDMPDDLYFFGGTALNRTHAGVGRLSEDIDLIATGRRSVTAERVMRAVEAALQRTHGRVTWEPGFTKDDVQPANATTADGVSIKIQVLSHDGYPDWPSETRQIGQHFADADSAVLRVPTRPSFVGWKTTAWLDRGASRDLYDLRSLALEAPFGQEEVEAFVRFGPTGKPPEDWMFRSGPLDDWRASLAGQVRLETDAQDALRTVRDAWASALGEDWSDSGYRYDI